MSEMERRYFSGPLPRAIAHRGFAPHGGENTLEAFEAALTQGADVLETDVRASSDGVALTIHDASLSRIARGDHRAVAETSWTELSSVRVQGAGTVTRLEDALDAFSDVPFNIDVKSARAIAPTVAAIARTGAGRRVCLTSFNPAVAREVVALARRECGRPVMASASRSTVAAFLASSSLGVERLNARMLAPYAALQVPIRFRGIKVITPLFVAAAHRAGCEVHAWTIDEEPTMHALLDMGVDGIVSNRVDRLVKVREARAARRTGPGGEYRPRPKR